MKNYSRLQACSLRHSIKRAMFSVVSKWTYLGQAGGVPQPLWLYTQVNMSVALVTQSKTRISFFLCTYFLLFCWHMQKNFFWGHCPWSPKLCPGCTWGLTASPPTHNCIQERYVLLSVHLNNWSIKKTLFWPLLSHMALTSGISNPHNYKYQFDVKCSSLSMYVTSKASY